MPSLEREKSVKFKMLVANAMLFTRISNVSDVFLPLFLKMSSERMKENDFCRACRGGDVATVRHLVSQGADINCRNGWGASGLYLAVLNGHDDIAMFLLSLPGIDVNIVTNDGDTPLHMAAWENRREIVKELLKRSDLRPDIKNVWGKQQKIGQ